MQQFFGDPTITKGPFLLHGKIMAASDFSGLICSEAGMWKPIAVLQKTKSNSVK